jgi:DNA-directed RNA polymerase subunit omega
MMLDPSIDQLQEKINSKYELVTLSARRARDLADSEKPLVEEPTSHTYVGIALEEIVAGKLYVANE